MRKPEGDITQREPNDSISPDLKRYICGNRGLPSLHINPGRSDIPREEDPLL